MIAPISEARNTEQPLLALGLASARAYPAFVGRARGGLRARSRLSRVRHDRRGARSRRRRGARPRARDATRPRTSGPAAALDRGSPSGTGPRSAAAPCARRFPTITQSTRASWSRRWHKRACGWGWSCGSVRRWPAVIVSGDRVHGVRLADGEQLAADQVVVADRRLVGRGSTAFPTTRASRSGQSRDRSCAYTIRPDRGSLTRALRMQGSGYVVPRGDGRYVARRDDGGARL